MADLPGWLVVLAASHPFLLLAGLFSLDGMGIPVLPEVATLVVFAPDPTLGWGLQILAIIVAAETVATAVLYLLVRRIGLPARLERAMARYTGMLLGRDERLILLNRVMPVLPAVGAFMHAAQWRPMRSLAFVAVGSAAKYGALLAGSALAFQLMGAREATLLSVGCAVLFVGLSWLVAWRRRKAQAPDPEPEPDAAASA